MIILSGAASLGSGNPADPGGPSPSDVSGLEIWLKANNSQFDSAGDGDQITTWNDGSGNSRNVTGVLRTNFKPRWKVTAGPNSYPAVLLHDSSGDGGYFTVPNFLTGFTAGNVFWVNKIVDDPPTVSSSQAPPCGDWGSAGDEYYPFDGDSKIYNAFGSTVRKTTNDPTTSLATWHVGETQTASGSFVQKINGALSGNDFFSTGTNTVGWSTAPFIARTATNTKFMRGWIAEIIFYSSVLSNTDRWSTVHTYLNNKYGFSLPTS